MTDSFARAFPPARGGTGGHEAPRFTLGQPSLDAPSGLPQHVRSTSEQQIKVLLLDSSDLQEPVTFRTFRSVIGTVTL